LSISETNYQNGVAFILGFLGLKGVEAVAKRFFKEKIDADN